MTARLAIFTLGGVRIQRAVEPVAGLTTKKAEALLIYLASTRRSQPREVLAELLWDERTQSQSMANLRGVLTNLRQVLGEYLVITREAAGLNPEVEIWLDTAELEDSLVEARKTGRLNATTSESLATSLELYKGEFLHGFSVFDCRGFEDWATRERERLHHLVVDGLSSLVDYELEQKEYQSGMAHASRLLELDPLNENAYRQMMQLLHAIGQRVAALAQFETCQKLLREELGVEPEAETCKLYDQIRAGEPGARVQPPSLPRETVTFLFTDIEGSTQLLVRLKDKYAILMDDHRRIMREAFSHWEGHEVDSQGDAFFVAFGRATQAVGAAAEVQRKVSEHTWPERVMVRVRMGLHTGESWTDAEGYLGMQVHRAARIAHVASGGQVLLSETTSSLVQDELPNGVTLLDLGRHVLKDIHRPEHIHQLVIEGLPAEFPPLASLATLPSESARPSRKVGACPYRGLAAFQEEDAPFYFGRETFVSALEQAVNARKLVAVIVGSSGSGKSSVLFAGLLPRLRKTDKYKVAVMRPGTQPFYSLAAALIDLLESDMSKTDLLAETRNLAERLTRREVGLAEVIGRIQKDSGSRQKVLLVIDQFEELYTLCTDKNLQKIFIDELLATVEESKAQRDGIVVILITLRADFMGQALAHRSFADSLQEAPLLLGPMNRPELHMAIEKPAEMQGAAFEPGLVERILDDVGEQPGNLPLFEFTLTQLWERQTDGWLTHDEYETMGCVDGALTAYANQVYADLDDAEQELTRHTFVQLVQPGEGTEDTRRIATREELGAESWKLIQLLADKRLVVAGRDAHGREIAEVVHEALIQQWWRFREWMNTDRAFRAWQERLRGCMRQWQESGRDEGALLAGAPLAVAQSWLGERGEDLNTAEIDYIRASQAMQAQHQKEREHRRQRTIIALSVGMVLVAILGAVALLASQRAIRSAQIAQNEANTRATAEAIAKQMEREARSRYLTSVAETTLLSDSQLSAHLALEAIKADPTYNGAESVLHQVLPELRLVNSTTITNTIGDDTRWLIRDGELFIWLTPEGIKVVDRVAGTHTMIAQRRNCDVVFPTEDGRWLVASCLKEKQLTDVPEYEHQVWEIETQKLLFTLPCPDTILTFGIIAPSPIHSLLVYATFPDASIHVWEVSSGKELFVLRGHSLTPELGYSNADMIASQDGKILATYGLDGMVILWDGETGDQLLQFDAQSAEVGSIDLSPDGLHLATSGFDETIKIWDITSLSTGPILERTISNISQGWTTIMYSPDGTRLASGVDEARVKVWDAQTGELRMTLTGHKGDAGVISFNQDGTRLYTNSSDRTIKEWDLSPGKEKLTLSGMIIGSTPFSPDGTKIAVSGADGSLSIVDSLTGAVLQSWQAHSDWMTDIAWSPDGNRLATSNGFSFGWWWDFPIGDNTAKIWDASTGQMIQEIPGEGSAGFTHLTWSPDSSQLVTTSWISGTTYIRNAESWDEVATHTVPPGDSFWSLAYSPDGQKIVSGSNTSIFVWDAATGTEVFTQTLDHTPLGLAFSPDGQLLAVSHMDGTIKLFEMTDTELKLEQILSGGDQSIYTVDFNPDGTLLAAGDISGVVRVWDLSTMQIRFEVATFTEPVSWVAFNPDGQRLFASNLSGTTYVYVLPLDELIDLVSSRIVLPMAEEECWKYLEMKTCPPWP